MGHTSTESQELSSIRTRRAVLAAAAAGVAATVVSGLGRVTPVSASTGDPVILGQNNQADAVTGIQNLSAGSTSIGLGAFSFGTGLVGQGFGVGVRGSSTSDANSVGVRGESNRGRGVDGISTSGEGVHGESSASNGVAGVSDSQDASGVYGENTHGGFGTYGRSNLGGGMGVYGEAAHGVGVVGNSEHEIGVQAISANGTALQAQGRVSFSTAGRSVVEPGSSQVTVTPGIDLVASSAILCTLESDQAGMTVERVSKDVTADTFTAFLSKKVPAGKVAHVAWFVIG